MSPAEAERVTLRPGFCRSDWLWRATVATYLLGIVGSLAVPVVFQPDTWAGVGVAVGMVVGIGLLMLWAGDSLYGAVERAYVREDEARLVGLSRAGERP